MKKKVKSKKGKGPGWLEIQRKLRKEVLPKEKKTEWIGQMREEMVRSVLEELKQKGEIHDFVGTGKLTFADLIKGVDFIFVYVEDVYKTISFSVTGPKWLAKHRAAHPEIPTISVRLNESSISIENKILGLKK